MTPAACVASDHSAKSKAQGAVHTTSFLHPSLSTLWKINVPRSHATRPSISYSDNLLRIDGGVVSLSIILIISIVLLLSLLMYLKSSFACNYHLLSRVSSLKSF